MRYAPLLALALVALVWPGVAQAKTARCKFEGERYGCAATFPKKSSSSVEFGACGDAGGFVVESGYAPNGRRKGNKIYFYDGHGLRFIVQLGHHRIAVRNLSKFRVYMSWTIRC